QVSSRISPQLLVDVQPELRPVEARLLQVVAEDLVELDELGAVLLDPAGEALVKLCASRLRQRVVRGVADEEVAEAVGVVAGELRAVGADQLLAHERDEALVDRAVTVGESRHCPAVEGASLDRAALE